MTYGIDTTTSRVGKRGSTTPTVTVHTLGTISNSYTVYRDTTTKQYERIEREIELYTSRHV